jgi:hypothetical protein
MTRVTEEDQTGAIGVTLVQLLVENELRWIFRRIDQRDTGIDAQVEVVLAGQATGLLLALQIKTGKSYFSSKTESGWRYRGDYEHLRYWREHNLSTLVVLVDEVARQAFWVFVGPDTTVNEARASWTIEVPADQVLSAECRTEWMDLAFAACPRDALYRYCVTQIRYIAWVAEGNRLLVEAQEWLNKIRGQCEFRLIFDREGDEVREEAFDVLSGARNPHVFVQKVFPWADVGIDEEFYETSGKKIRPYESDGEVASYRFELTLNPVGEAIAALAAAAEALEEYPPYYFARVLSSS